MTFTRHARERMTERAITEANVTTIVNGNSYYFDRGKYVYVWPIGGYNCSVVVTANWRVITAYWS